MHFFPFPYQSSFRSRAQRSNFLLSGRGLGFIVCSVTSQHYENAREISMEITCDKAISCHVLDGYTSVMAQQYGILKISLTIFKYTRECTSTRRKRGQVEGCERGRIGENLGLDFTKEVGIVSHLFCCSSCCWWCCFHFVRRCPRSRRKQRKTQKLAKSGNAWPAVFPVKARSPRATTRATQAYF